MVDNVLNTFWTTEAMWPVEGAGFVFLARAMHEIGRKRFGVSWTGLEPWATFRRGVDTQAASATDAIERWQYVRETTVKLFLSGTLVFYTAKVDDGAPKAVAPSKTLELWYHRAADLGERFGKCQIDLQHQSKQTTYEATGDIVHEARMGQSTDFRWMFVDRSSLNTSLSHVAIFQPAALPTTLAHSDLPVQKRKRGRPLGAGAHNDSPWVEKMRGMLIGGAADSIWAAAGLLSLTSEIKGASPDAIQHRLTAKFLANYPHFDFRG